MREIFHLSPAMNSLYRKAQELSAAQLKILADRFILSDNGGRASGHWLRNKEALLFSRIKGSLGSLGVCPFRCITSEVEILQQLVESQKRLSTCGCITTAGLASDALSVDFFRSYWGTCGAVARCSPVLACLFFGISYSLAEEVGRITENASVLEIFSRFYCNSFELSHSEWLFAATGTVRTREALSVRKAAAQALHDLDLARAWEESGRRPIGKRRQYMSKARRGEIYELAGRLAQLGLHSTSLARQIWLRTNMYMATAKNTADRTPSSVPFKYPYLSNAVSGPMVQFFERAMVRALGGNFSEAAVADAVIYAAWLARDYFTQEFDYSWLDFFERRAYQLLRTLPGSPYFNEAAYCGESHAASAQLVFEERECSAKN